MSRPLGQTVGAPKRTVTPAACRETLGLFTTGVTVIAAFQPESAEPHGMTANAFMSISLEPPLVLVSVRHDARLHDVLRAAGAYGVSVLGESLEREARRFAGMAVDDGEAPAFVEHAGVPVLRDATTFATGDHTLFVGEIVALAAERPDEPPLAFHRSAFGRVVSSGSQVPFALGDWGDNLGWWA